jgi:hypothetical protein
MSESLPYLVSPGTVKTGLEKIRAAATPDKVTGDWVSTVLNMRGGTGRAFLSFIKKLGLVGRDGTPTALYSRFRNSTTSGQATAEAIKIAYKPLKDVNESFYVLGDKELKDLIVQITGVSSDSRVLPFIFQTLKALKAYATFDNSNGASERTSPDVKSETAIAQSGVSPEATKRELTTSGIGMNLSYTINLNLPATSDQSVFNAIFRSLKEHLLSNAD